MNDDHKQVIVIKKIVRGKKEHHGGSWKIAYADFVTAMMAFFMLLWLLSLLNKYQLQGISAYFQRPLSDIFVGKKNSGKHKNQTDQQIIEIKNNRGGSEKTKDKKKLNDKTAPAKVEQESKIDKDKKIKLTPSAVKSEKMKNHTTADKERIKKSLEISLKNSKAAKALKDNLNFEIVKDGVKISLRDTDKNQMFSLGQADFKNYARPVISWLSGEFNQLPNKIIIIGHTDANQYDYKAEYTNWELSTDRANVVRHLLISDGMGVDKVIRVEGAGAVSLLDKNNGGNPINRRVEIILLTDEAAKRIISE